MRWFLVSILSVFIGYVFALPAKEKLPILKIGITLENPPLAFQADKNHFYGFEVDLMDELCKRAMVQCHYLVIPNYSILSHLDNQTIDFVLAGLYAPKMDLSHYILSYPYLETDGLFLTLKDAPIHSLDELKNKTIGIKEGLLSNSAEYLAMASQYTDSAKIKKFSSTYALVHALSNHSIDAAFAGEAFIEYWYNSHPQIYKLMGKPLTMDNQYVIMSTPRQEKLMGIFNSYLMDAMKDGTYEHIYKHYFNHLMQ